MKTFKSRFGQSIINPLIECGHEEWDIQWKAGILVLVSRARLWVEGRGMTKLTFKLIWTESQKKISDRMEGEFDM